MNIWDFLVGNNDNADNARELEMNEMNVTGNMN